MTNPFLEDIIAREIDRQQAGEETGSTQNNAGE